MKQISLTLREVQTVFSKAKISWLLTRYNEYVVPNDLDILVHPADFKKALDSLEKEGYTLLSHDHALGGRIEGMQMNCIKQNRMKIDLHQDFTWRKTTYTDQKLIWNFQQTVVSSTQVATPAPEIDAFLVFINILFEKTYLSEGDFKFLKKHLQQLTSNTHLKAQAKKYGWLKSYNYFASWLLNKPEFKSKVQFLPVWLVLHSYFEKSLHDRKLDFVSFAYYLFFRTRAAISKTLPYE